MGIVFGGSWQEPSWHELTYEDMKRAEARGFEKGMATKGCDKCFSRLCARCGAEVLGPDAESLGYARAVEEIAGWLQEYGDMEKVDAAYSGHPFVEYGLTPMDARHVAQCIRAKFVEVRSEEVLP